MTKEYRKVAAKASPAGTGCCKVGGTEQKLQVRERQYARRSEQISVPPGAIAGTYNKCL
jgi:hypothetical protein